MALAVSNQPVSPMKIKVVRSIVNSLSQMCCSARINTTLELLSDLPDGTVEVDLQGASCRHSGIGDLKLPLVEDFRTWLVLGLEDAGLSLGLLQQAQLSLQYCTNRVPTDRTRILLFDLHARCQIKLQNRLIEGHSVSALWYHRLSPQ